MHRVKPLPSYLVQRYQGWKATTYAENKAWYARLADEGQRPRAMIIGCCDSRINLNAIFGADLGEAFIHRNVANLVPPHEPDGEHHGTSAAVEYAVEGLRVAHIVVIGHTNCGGVKACYEMCAGRAPELEREESYVGRWMDILAPAYPGLPDGDEPARVEAFERAAVITSLENLITFPFVDRAMNEGRLSIHGAVADLADGGLEVYDAADRAFAAI
ncbi:MAG: carbonic anhydrase [Paracoccaceae bacterium]|nr:carbonic anhydrase [Paracoccaceae bacterium]